jgi:hypothetical protein
MRYDGASNCAVAIFISVESTKRLAFLKMPNPPASPERLTMAGVDCLKFIRMADY